MTRTRRQLKSETMAQAGSEVMDTLKNIQLKISDMSGSIDSLCQQVTQIQTEMSAIKDLKTSIEFTQANLEEVETSVASLKESVKAESDRADVLNEKSNKNQAEIKWLKEKILAQDTYTRRENLIFEGIPEDPDESNKQTVVKICELFTDQLEIQNAKDILFQRCHRMGPRSSTNSSKPREIIVRFAFFSDREKIWSNRNKFKGTEIIVKEDFPEEIEQRRYILFQVFKAARAKKNKK